MLGMQRGGFAPTGANLLGIGMGGTLLRAGSSGPPGLWGDPADPTLPTTPPMRRYERVLSELWVTVGTVSTPLCLPPPCSPPCEVSGRSGLPPWDLDLTHSPLHADEKGPQQSPSNEPIPPHFFKGEKKYIW